MWLTLNDSLQEHMIRVTATGLPRGTMTRQQGSLQACPSSSQPAQAAKHTSLPSARSKVQHLCVLMVGIHPLQARHADQSDNHRTFLCVLMVCNHLLQALHADQSENHQNGADLLAEDVWQACAAFRAQ